MKKISLHSFIDLIMLFYILSLYLLTYREGLNTISNVLALMLMSLIWLDFLTTRRKLIFNKFLKCYGLFIIICLAPSFYAINQSVSLSKVKTLVSIFILMISIANYVDTFEKIKKIMFYFICAGFLASIYTLVNADFSHLTRYGGELGNVNAIGMIVGISSIFSFYFILEEKKVIYLPILIINIVMILLTGSRKSLLLLILGINIILLSKDNGLKSRFKALLGSVILVIICFYLIFNVPIFYEIIGDRMENLFSLVSGERTTDGSINARANMIKLGFYWFSKKPFTGYGIDNYRFLYGGITGWRTYSHNNIIELLVGIGIFGTLLFYFTHFIVLKELFKASRYYNKSLCYCFIAIIISYTFLSVGLIYYYDKHISLLLVLGSVMYRITKTDKSIGKLIT